MQSSGSDDAAATNVPPDLIDAHAASTEWRGPAPVFYRINLAKITRAEYGASLSPLKTLWALLLLRVLRVKAPASADDPAVDSLAPFMTPSLRASGPVKEQFEAMAAELASAGFHSPVCYAIDDYFHSTGTVLMCFAHRHLPIMARLHLRVWAFKNPPAAALFTEFVTAYTDGSYVWSMSSRPDLATPPNCRVVRRTGAAPLELLKAHQAELAQRGVGMGGATVRVVEAEEAVVLNERFHECVKDFHVARGVFVPLTEQERAHAVAKKEVRQEAVSGGSKYPDVMVEIDRIQNHQGSSRGGLILLIVTMLLFLFAGVPGQTSIYRALALIPILLFHEAGHYIAMRLSGYRNVKMFFIPGFGAAVTGRAYNVAGWKKAVVSLMGPVPGIVVGIIVGLCGMVFQSPFAIEAAFLTVLLNGFNLIPLMPFDGGQIVHSLLFSRHYILDVLFRGAAGAAMLAAYAGTNSYIFLMLAIFVLMAIPSAYRTGKVMRELRREGFRPVSRDDQTIPRDAAERIITKLREGSTKTPVNAITAQQTISVFEALNARPPGWIATIVLGGAYLASLAAAIVFFVVFAAAKNGTMPRFMGSSSGAPSHTVAAAEVKRAGAAPTLPTDQCNTVVATHSSRAKAEEAYAKATAQLRLGESASLVGDTVMIRIPASDGARRTHWIDTLEAGSTEAFVDGQGMRASFEFRATAPNAKVAAEINEAFASYFELPTEDGRIVAPWSPTGITAEQRRARATLSRLLDANPYSDPELKALSKRMEDARRRGETDAAKAMRAEYTTLERTIRIRLIEEIARDPSDAIDQTVVKHFLERLKSSSVNIYEIATAPEILERLGTVALIDGRADPAGDRTAGRYGYMNYKGLELRIDMITFHDPAEGAAAVARWLEAQGCTKVRYHVEGYSTEEDEDVVPGD